MRKNIYEVYYSFVKVIEFTDEEMREHNYEGEITDDMRREYFQNLLEEERQKDLNAYHFTSEDCTDIDFSPFWEDIENA